MVSARVPAAVVLTLLVGTPRPTPGAQLQPGHYIADPVLQTIDRTTVHLSDTGGHVRLIYFWATWASPCETEMPRLQQLHNEYGGRGFSVIAVNSGATSDAVIAFMAEHALSFPVLLASAEAERSLGPIDGYPTGLLVDRNGLLLKRFVGLADGPMLENAVRQALGLPAKDPPIDPGPSRTGRVIDRIMPDVELRALDQSPISLQATRGDVVLVDFWATWCAPCLEEIPLLNRLEREYRGLGFTVLSIHMGDEREEQLRLFALKHNIGYPVLFGNDRVERAFGGVFGYPSSFLVNSEGRIVRTFIGAKPQRSLENEIRALLELPPLPAESPAHGGRP